MRSLFFIWDTGVVRRVVTSFASVFNFVYVCYDYCAFQRRHTHGGEDAEKVARALKREKNAPLIRVAIYLIQMEVASVTPHTPI